MVPRLVVKTIAAAGLVILGAIHCAALDSVAYKALLEKSKVKLGEKVQFMVAVDYSPGTMAPSITPPSFEQFSVINDYETTKEQGQGQDRYLTLKKMWLLEPNETGRLSIASAIVTFQDPSTNLLQNGKTDVVFLDVLPGDEAAAAKPGADGTKSADAKSDGKGRLPWIGAGAVMLLLLIAVFRPKSSSQPAASKVSPEDVSLSRLQAAIEHAEAGNLDQYYSALSRTLLDYLQAKFGLDAHVLSTSALMDKLLHTGIPAAIVKTLEHFFQVADKAKFGGYTPDEDEMIVLHRDVKNFIEAGRRIKVKLPKQPKKPKTDDD